jgi:hypothetical protein
MGSKDPNTGKWTARQLSNDHKPSLASEAQRIWRCNGRIEAMKDNRGIFYAYRRLSSGSAKGMVAKPTVSRSRYDPEFGRSYGCAGWRYMVTRNHR